MEERPEENLDREESIEEEAPEVEGHRRRFDVEEEGVGRKKRGPEAEDDLEKGRKRYRRQVFASRDASRPGSFCL